MTMAAITHLYWMWQQPRMFDRIRLGYSLCGQQQPREKLTRFVDDVTCNKCRELAAQREKEAP
jgi:hypothetical protein